MNKYFITLLSESCKTDAVKVTADETPNYFLSAELYRINLRKFEPTKPSL